MRSNNGQDYEPDELRDAFFCLDVDWNFTFVSEQAEGLMGRPASRLLGRNLWEEYPDAVGSVYDREYRHAVRDQVPVSFEIPDLYGNTHFEFTAYPTAAGLSVYFHDVTRERNTEEALRTSESHVALAAEAAGVGWFFFDLADERMQWSDRCKAIFGVSPEEEITPERFEAMIHPDDRNRVMLDLQGAMANGTDHAVEYRVVKADGELGWVSAVGRVRYDAEGSPVRFAGIAQDVTQRKRLEEEVEAVRLSVLERERNITAALQTAAQPDLPRVAPGLDLAFFFKAALDEADIGGDFADVYPLSSGSTSLIVGDLSGKGLAAASQVFTVRHALRAFLFTEPSLVVAVSQLNSFVIQGDLLPGFVTLFAAAFDPVSNSLNYVSCGHEPGLIRRADTRVVEALLPTGPILGADEKAVYTERRVTLNAGDFLILYTDGLTEVGTGFRDFLGVEGLTRLLAESRATESVGLMSGIVTGVQEYAKGILRDDACLLAAVVL